MTDPFYLDKETNAPHYYSVGKKTQDMVLYAKFNLKEESSFRNRMIGGVFTGSNHSDFSDEDTLFIIQSKPDRLNTTVKCWSDKEYRYLRYIGRPKAHCNVSAVAFYEKMILLL